MDFRFKNKLNIAAALLGAVLQIFLLKEIFQMLIAGIFGAGNSSISFNFPLFIFYFEPLPDSSMPVLILSYFAPYIYLVLSVEIASIILRKIPPGGGRFFILVFNLIQIGYLLIHIFYSAVILLLNPQLENDWIALSLYLNFGEMERFVFAFGIIFLFVFYLNMSTKRLVKYINY